MEKETVTHRLEISEEVWWLSLWVAIIIGIVSLVAIMCYHERAIAKLAFDAGYEETMLPGKQSTSWVKAR